jgi:type 1 glutamine amidotransferase
MPVTYVPIKKDHPIVAGVENFTGMDEKYFCHIDVADVDDIFLCGDDPTHPGSIAGWCRTVGKGRTAAVTPGHTFEIVENPNMTRLVKNAAAWVLKSHD